MTEKTNATDSQLIKLYIDGDKGAISTLIEHYAKRVKRYINMMVHDSSIADDIFQDTFIKVISKIDDGKYIDKDEFLSWVLRIAHNQTIDYFRRNKSQTNLMEREAGFNLFNDQQFSEHSIEDKIINKQTEEHIRKLVAALPKEQREAVEMRYFMGYSFKDIAEATDVSVNTALGRVRYALINLRKMGS